MKHTLKLFSLCILMITAVLLAAFSPQQKNKDKDKPQKEKQIKQKEVKKDDFPKADKGHRGIEEEKNSNKNNKANTDNDHEKVKKEKGDDDDYRWDRETFKDRKKLKNKDKVTVCHKFNRNNEQAVTIRVSSQALKAHLGHGDVMGDCPVVRNTNFSDDYIKRRNAYYNDLQSTQDQVLYSRSILDYTLLRLANARLQLNTLQTSGVPIAEIERKQVVVQELEQNATLLEQLIGVAVNLVVSKLTN